MKQATTQGLYQYWNTMRGGRIAPRRYEIEPSQIVRYLAETIILEQPESDGCRFRVAGTSVDKWLGHDLRGQLFYELWSEADRLVLRDNLGTIAQHGAVGLFQFDGELVGERVEDAPPARFEMLLLPLAHVEERIERVLGSISLMRAPAWLSASMPNRLTLTSNALVWPDGRPHSLANKAQTSLFGAPELPSLGPHAGVRHARIVRSDRRSFLVYDGGLSQEPNRDDK